MKVNWLLVAIIALAVWWLFMNPKIMKYANHVCQAAPLDESVEPAGAVPAMLPSVAGVAMGSSAYRAKTCGSCGM